MNLAIVAHNLVRGDGQGRINLEIAKHALEKGHRVRLLARRVDPELVKLGAEWQRIESVILRPGIFDIRLFGRQCDRVLRSMAGQVDCVVGNGYTLSVPHQINLCQFVHGTWIKSKLHVARTNPGMRGCYQYFYSAMNARWEKSAYTAARTIVAPSHLARKELLAIGVAEDKINVIPNGVDLNEFSPGPASREELGLPANVPLCLFVGDIKTSRKNLDSVLHAMVRVPSVHLAVVGQLRNSPFPALAEKLGVAGRVHFLGFRSDVGNLFRAVDLFVFPSRYDTFALVVLEAMAAGVPVITTSTVGASELMNLDSGTVLSDPENVDELTSAMQRHLVFSPVQLAIAKAAARTLAEAHSWRAMSEQYLELMHRNRTSA